MDRPDTTFEPRSQARRSERSWRPVPLAALVGLTVACLAGTSSAADPIASDADTDAMTMEHGQMGDGHATDAAAVMDHGAGPAGHDAPEGAAAMHAPALASTSAAGLYRVELRGLPDPVPLNRMHEWIVHVERSDGTPVTGALIEMDGGMPIHDHGLPTAPRVTEELGAGDYRLEGVRFQMGGHWVVELAIDAEPGADSVSFDLNL